QYSAPRQAKPPAQSNQSAARQQAAPGQAAPKSGASRWLGPLAGLAAGGLLASMFFGDGFEGFQIMDFLLIAALVFGGVMLFKMFRNRATGPGRVPAGAAAGAGQGYGGAPTPGSFGGMSGGSDTGATAGGPANDAPVWFDDAGFVDGAKTHFIRLQAAWDQADFRDISEYTAPQLFAEIKREREALGDAPNYTEVVTLNAELLSVQRDADQVVASVRFSGLIREEESGAAKPLDEIWHVAHDWDSADGDWLISGIQQAS
ncbi:MAG: TIM44-like domain-containing protein, partial [Thiohalocapsa sp.]